MLRCPQCGQDLPDDARFCFRDGTPLDGGAKEQVACVDARIGRTVGGRYRIIALLGEGGMGAVYLARHQTLGKLVAIKFLHEDQANLENPVERFLIEAKAAARLDHPNIVSIYDFGRDRHNAYYLVMEYVEGEGLHELLSRNEPFDQLRTIGVIRQILSAAAAAHQANIVHRDLKPENIIVIRGRSERDQLKILDFGLAKIVDQKMPSAPLTLEGHFIGTPAYVAPERVRTAPLDGRCDLYSIGIIAFELLTGSPPFVGDPLAVLRAHMLTPPPTLKEAQDGLVVNERFESLIQRLMAKNREDRPPSAEITLAELEKIEAEISGELAAASIDEVIEAGSWSQTLETIACQCGRSTTSKQSGDKLNTAHEIEADWLVWESGELLLEMRRLSELWREHLTELSRGIWGEGIALTGIEAATTAIRTQEEKISDRENEILRTRADLRALDQQLRDDESSLRFGRLELVTRLETLKEALGAEIWTAAAVAQHTEPIDEQHLDTIELLPGYRDLDHMKKEFVELNRKIEQSDRQNRLLQRDHEIARLGMERNIHTLLLEIRDFHQELGPRYTALNDLVNRGAKNIPELIDLLTTVNELTEAIDSCHGVLATLD
jgi:serine/threonine protein kinase